MHNPRLHASGDANLVGHAMKRKKAARKGDLKKWRGRRDSNSRPSA